MASAVTETAMAERRGEGRKKERRKEVTVMVIWMEREEGDDVVGGWCCWSGQEGMELLVIEQDGQWTGQSYAENKEEDVEKKETAGVRKKKLLMSPADGGDSEVTAAVTGWSLINSNNGNS